MSAYQFEENNNGVVSDSSVDNQKVNTSTTNSSGGDSVNKDWKPEEVPQLTVDVHKKDQTIYVVSTIAGVKAEDLDISIDDQTLTIRGMRKKPYTPEDSDVLLEECFWGEFYRELTINENLNVAEIRADLKDGVLVIQIPVIKVVAQKKIKVNMG
ncbi:Hsp20/alpha crystallin family protein [Candidatus Gracilibacteria bacterium]|nr:Hsp20/alpha crystallin family protein [Candidatus Gracilibacteria bacterium]NJS41199.1 Hsp20/alpha crystallin family protein [Candidatus Gracilibacteria bacterium]